jgi:hypothetical protein
MEMSHHLLYEPYLDAALHGVLLHPPSQIPDHMPYTYSFLVLLLPSTSTYIVSNIHIIYNNFLWLIEKLGALTRKNFINFGLVTSSGRKQLVQKDATAST